MAYKTGDLDLETAESYNFMFGEPDDDEPLYISDARADDGDPPVTLPYAYLPHSCDRWVVGGPAHVRALIADLQAVLAKMESV